MILEIFPVGLLQCNCTLLGDEGTREAIVVDPGDEVARIHGRLMLHGLTLRQILITHAHIDHVGGALKLKALTGAPVFLNQADLPLLQMMSEQAAWLGVGTPETAPPDEDLPDGRRVGLEGYQAEVLHTPGHTQGSICLHFPVMKMVLAGDTLFAGGIGRTDLPGGNQEQILSSIRDRLLRMPDDVRIVPGHGPATTIGTERAANPFLSRIR